MQVNRVQKKLRVTRYDSVRFQIITEYVFFKKEALIPIDIEIPYIPQKYLRYFPVIQFNNSRLYYRESSTEWDKFQQLLHFIPL